MNEPVDSLSVLLVDDDPFSRLILEEIFHKNGIVMVSTEAGLEAVELARLYRPAVILLDIHLPDLDGFQVFDRLKARTETSDIPVIFLTGQSSPEDVIRGLSAGGVDYITKPFIEQVVLARILVQARLKRAYETIIALQRGKLDSLKAAFQSFNQRIDQSVDPECKIYYRTAQEAGSDQCDVVSPEPGVYGYFLADVEGHGIESSYLASSLRVLFRENSGLFGSPPALLDRLNLVIRDFLSGGQHITGVYALLDRRTGRLTLASAGHLPALIQRVQGDVETLTTSSDVLGVFEQPQWGLETRTLQPGDRLWLYTDGVIEDKQRYGNWLTGLQVLKSAIASTAGRTLDQSLDQIRTTLQLDHRLADDCLVLVVQA